MEEGIFAAREAVGVVGLGAIGTVLAAALAEARHPVVACGRRPLDRVKITDQRGTRTYPVRPATAAEDLPFMPWVPRAALELVRRLG
jgi:ketopantoate reductase